MGLKHCEPERPRAPFRELLAVVAQTTRLRVLSMSLRLHTVCLHATDKMPGYVLHAAATVCNSNSWRHSHGEVGMLRIIGMLCDLGQSHAPHCCYAQQAPEQEHCMCAVRLARPAAHLRFSATHVHMHALPTGRACCMQPCACP